jgi:hypothetical protein
MQKLQAAAFGFGLAFLPLISPCQTTPPPQPGMQMCITGGASGNVPGCPATSGTPSVAGTQLAPAAREKLMREARLAYYNLHARGLKEFSCQVLPDWDATYKSLRGDAVGRDQLLPILKKVRFRVLVGATGAASVSHQSDVAPPSAAVAARVEQSTGGIDQVVSGFFQTWSLFTFGTFFAEASGTLQVEEAGDKYRLTEKDASTDALVVMNKDLTIEHATVESPRVTGSMDPIFTATTEGLFQLPEGRRLPVATLCECRGEHAGWPATGVAFDVRQLPGEGPATGAGVMSDNIYYVKYTKSTVNPRLRNT